jgi:hypothetical protein
MLQLQGLALSCTVGLQLLQQRLKLKHANQGIRSQWEMVEGDEKKQSILPT